MQQKKPSPHRDRILATSGCAHVVVLGEVDPVVDVGGRGAVHVLLPGVLDPHLVADVHVGRAALLAGAPLAVGLAVARRHGAHATRHWLVHEFVSGRRKKII